MLAGDARKPDRGELRVLIVEDNPHDAELCLQALARAGRTVRGRRVENERELRAALLESVPDVVLCDFTLPSLDGYEAQQIVRETYPECPLIFVSGSLTERNAAMALQTGAVDYVMKSSLVRLPIAVERAVGATRAAALASARAQRHLQRLGALWRIAHDSALRGFELTHAMLRQAARDLGTRPFRVFLIRVDDGTVVPLASSHGGGDALRSRRERDALAALGARAYDEEDPIRSWGDLTCATDAPAALRKAGWRAAASLTFQSRGTTYVLAFGSRDAAATDFGSDDTAYLGVIALALANQLEIEALAESLRDEEARSRAHARRLEELWPIVNDAGLDDAGKWLAMISLGARSIWPGLGYRGMLWSVEGDTQVLEAVGESPDHRLALPALPVGLAIPVTDSVVGIALHSGGGTFSWGDLIASEPSLVPAREHAARSVIATTFVSGATTWALTFASGGLTNKPLGPLEHAYVEVLASFFAHNVQQRWHVAQLRNGHARDPLTGLLSRSEFLVRANAAAAARPRHAIVVVDIDAFHEINESFGRATGDAILVAVATALEARAGAGDFVGRVGDDDFALFLADPPSDATVRERAAAIAAIFALPFAGGESGATYVISACVGVAHLSHDGSTVDASLSQADAALASAKERGHGSLAFFEPGMDTRSHSRTTLRNEIGTALACDQFELYYQPHLDIATGAVTGCEALIRWNHPTRGLVAPVHFIPFAEQNGLIAGIDDWVMRHAFKAVAKLCATRPGFRLYFNLSRRQAGNPTIVRAFVDAARRGVPLSNLGVEITETDAMGNIAATHRVFRALRRLNVSIAIDDFGTGYSSLSSLRALPVDIIKIDRSFVSCVADDPDNAAIAKTIISIADHFGFESLGEGAETPAEVGWLGAHGCKYVQGYAISHPLPIDAFRAWLSDRESA